MPPKKRAATQAAEKKTCEFLACASIPLREIGPNQFPIRIASGCLIDYGGRRWILTVAHATGNGGNWTIEMRYEEGRGALLYRIGAMNVLGLLSLYDGRAASLDLAYAEVPGDLQPYWQPRDEQAQIVKTLPRVIFEPDLQYRPARRKLYGFGGGVKQTEEHHFGKLWHGTELVCYPRLKFMGEDEQFYFFDLPFARGGHELFKGTSGAPICDRKRNIAALVCGPGEEPNTIRGIKMHYFRQALDVELIQLAAGAVENREAQ
jgi:hypothetical protein